jgi:hypothetical protein
MAVRLVCQACGKRLKLPDGAERKRSAKCPKCLAPIDLTAALEASAYMPTIAVPGMAAAVAASTSTVNSPRTDAEANRKPPALLGEDDPLPYPIPKPAAAPTRPAPPPLPAGASTPSPSKPVPPPLPSGGISPPLAEEKGGGNKPHATEEVLSLDDDDHPGEPVAEPPPFRVPVRVLADSLRQVVGPCFAVLVPHGMFLENEPMKPFLYVPVRSRVESPATGELTVTLPDRRAVTLRIETRYARSLARDTLAFLAGERPVPAAADYRRKWWMLWAALIFALGLAGGPLVLSQTANLGLEFGLQVGAGFALLGLFANIAVVVFSRWSVPGQIVVMAGVCLLVTGVFLFGATAYLAGRQKAVEEAKPDPPPVIPPPVAPGVHTPGSPNPPDPPPVRPPSHLDRAKKNGTSALEDGPADVISLALAPDANTLAIGHADGTVRLWPLDQPTFEAMLPGPKADSPVLRVQFDAKNHFVFAYTATGVIAAPRNGPPAISAKIPGTLVAIAPEPDGERVRFAAIRGNTVQHRTLAATFIQNPPMPKGKPGPYAIPTTGKGGDEAVPEGKVNDPQKPGGVAARKQALRRAGRRHNHDLADYDAPRATESRPQGTGEGVGDQHCHQRLRDR